MRNAAPRNEARNIVLPAAMPAMVAVLKNGSLAWKVENTEEAELRKEAELVVRKNEEVSSSRTVDTPLPLVAVMLEEGHTKAEVAVAAGLCITTPSVWVTVHPVEVLVAGFLVNDIAVWLVVLC